ncbi:MAG: hypothetical protein L0Y57_13670 [Beijerinckiaceae bacterium]|nr:hypothetical protein [Beijerinckiaceae bacterium]
MVDETDSFTLEYMRRFDRRLNDFDAKLDRALDGLHTVKVRLAAVEENLAGVQRRIEEPVERIGRRLDLSGAPH